MAVEPSISSKIGYSGAIQSFVIQGPALFRHYDSHSIRLSTVHLITPSVTL